MPELPDVEVFNKQIQKNGLNKEIKSVIINDDRVLISDASAIKKSVSSKPFTKTKRIGKQLFIQCGNNIWLSMHFGMTGYPYFFKEKEKEPKHSCVLFEFKGDDYFSFVCSRKFGKIGLIDTLESFLKANELGDDALEIDSEKFIDIIKSRSGKIKNTLMDQSLISGIGNVYSDEILYQSKIHPEKKAKSLEEKALKNIFSVMQRVLKTAINNDADPSQMPDNYLLKRREEGGDCPKCKGKIKKIKVSGRSCYICESCQKL